MPSKVKLNLCANTVVFQSNSDKGLKFEISGSEEKAVLYHLLPTFFSANCLNIVALQLIKMCVALPQDKNSNVLNYILENFSDKESKINQ